MTTYKVYNWNEYSTRPENSRLVSAIEVEAFSARDALHKAEPFANKWNREETRKNMIVTMMTCEGFIKTV